MEKHKEIIVIKKDLLVNLLDNIQDIMVKLDEKDKIVFLPYKELYNKLNTMSNGRKIWIVNMLSFSLENNYTTTSQISDILKIIKDEIYSRYHKIKDFIKVVDESGKIVFLSREDLWKKIYNTEDKDYISFYSDFINLLSSDLLSNEHIIENWNNREGLKQVFNERYDEISKREDREWQKSIKEFVRSDKPIKEKVKFLVELIADIGDVELNLDNSKVIKPKKKFLKILLKELKDKQKFEKTTLTPKQSQPEPITIKSNENLNTTNDNPYPRIFFKIDGYLIFKKLQEKLVRERFSLADYSFIYRKMISDSYIHPGVKELEFRNWLLKKFDVEICEPLKTINECETDNKYSIYSLSINQ